MQAGYINQVISSFYLWFDHTLLKTGQAYSAVTGSFFKIPNKYSNLQTYAAPFKPFVADASITGAMTGVYLNSNLVGKGQSGLYEINYNEGCLYFTGLLPLTTQVTGSFSVKDIDVKITSEPEEKLLFETKYQKKPKTYQILSGIHEDQTTYPVVFLKYFGGNNEPAALGGCDWTNVRVRAIVIADSEFRNLAIDSLFEDRVRTLIPVLTESEMPYNALGGVNSGYNYINLVSGKNQSTNSIFLEKVSVSPLNYSAYSNLRELNPNIYCSLIDFDLRAYRQPRTNINN